MTTYTIEVLLQAIADVRAQLHHSADLHICNRIMDRARELAAAQPSADGPCQFCGGVGCVRCSARKQPSASEPVACPYLLEGTRFKLSFDRRGNVGVFSNYAEELDGRWVALVDATDNRHMAAPQPSPQQAGECDCELVAHGKWKNDQEIELCAASDPKALNLYLCDSHRQAGTRKVTDEIDMAKVWESFKFIESACSCHDQERGGSSDEDLAIVRAALESFAATRAQSTNQGE